LEESLDLSFDKLLMMMMMMMIYIDSNKWCVYVYIYSNPCVSNYLPTDLKYHLFSHVHFYLRYLTVILILSILRVTFILYDLGFFFYMFDSVKRHVFSRKAVT
jgi:hypothetical protein